MPVISNRVQPEEIEIRFLIEDIQKGVSDTTQKILEEIKKNPSISRDELAEKCGLTSDGIKYNIRKLREKGIIKRIAPDKGGHWEIIE